MILTIQTIINLQINYLKYITKQKENNYLIHFIINFLKQMIMKKYFIFAALVTAGLLTSCSSSDDAISETPNVPTSNESDLVAIKIGVAKPSASITRGTGTVGGVVNGSDVAVNNDGSTAGAPANSWAGQKVNVYMFNHGSLTPAVFQTLTANEDIYNNAELTTPTTSSTGIADYLVAAADLQNAAVPERYVKYYPMTGNYDFWGYRVDGAAAAAPAAANGVLSTTISVNGTQDVLSGVANIPADYAALSDATTGNPVLKAAVDAYANANSITDDDDAYTEYKANRLFSASSARAGVQPELMFGHMMTRLTFDAYAGSDNAKKVTDGDGDPTNFDPDATPTPDVYNGVYVAGIKVRAISSIAAGANPGDDPVVTYVDPTQGTFNIAGTAANFKPTLTWATTTTAPTAFELMKRPVGFYEIADPTNIITAAAYALLTTEQQAAYKEFTANDNLIPLIDQTVVVGPNNDPDYDRNGAILLWNTTTNGSTKNTIGEAIIAPSAAAYEVEIILCQTVVKTETLAGVPVTYTTKEWNTIKKTFRAGYDSTNEDTFFQPGTSYNFSIKVYGLEKIEIKTTLKPWVFGETVTIDTDD